MTGWQIFLAVVLLIVVVGAWMAVYQRRLFVRGPFRVLLPSLYRRRVVGLENFPKEGGCVVVSNHVSWIDGILILWMLPRNVRFVVDGENFDSGFRRFLGSAFDTILMFNNPKSIGRALKTAREGVKAGEVIGLFPEGTISRTGQLQAFKPGLKNIMKGTDGVVVPMWLDGMWGSVFSFSKGRFFFKWPKLTRRRLTLYVGEPVPGNTPLDAVRSKVQSLGALADREHRGNYPNLAKQIIRVWRRRGRRLQSADSLGQQAGDENC